MPLKRLDRARASLPAGYRFGDAKGTVIEGATFPDDFRPDLFAFLDGLPVGSLAYRLTAPMYEHADGTISPFKCLSVTANVIEGEQH